MALERLDERIQHHDEPDGEEDEFGDWDVVKERNGRQDQSIQARWNRRRRERSLDALKQLVW